jgi:hypothetical protein
MNVTYLKRGAALLVAAGLIGTGLFAPPPRAADKAAPADGDPAARVDKTVQAWQPLKEERRLDDIGWAKDIRDGLRLAKEHNRPIFLFTYSGSAIRENAMALQRC